MYITRKSESFLKEWKVSPRRKPLIIRGARQTGKSRFIEEFGKRYYSNLVILNLEKEKKLWGLFDQSEPFEIIRELEIIKDVSIKPGETLIFIDEIQECAAAIAKLRYFYEELKEYHVIAAGSLLEFVLENENLSFPVGRVDFQYLYPLTFNEFLGGCGKGQLVEFLKNVSIKDKISSLLHEECRKFLSEYLIIGGMPESVTNFLETNQYRGSEHIKESIIETYRDDFKKYSKRVNIDNLDYVFRESPRWIGKKMNLTKMGAGEVMVREVSMAVNLLQRAMVLFRNNRCQSVSFPLIPYKKAQPRILFLDLGLVQYMNRITQEILEADNYNSIYKGGFVEQLVGQEFLALLGDHKKPELYYWQRETKSSTAEIDYLFPYRSYLLPVEVKAGRGTTLFSLHQFVCTYNPPIAIRIYDGTLQLEELRISDLHHRYKLLSVPLYMISEIPRLLESLIL